MATKDDTRPTDFKPHIDGLAGLLGALAPYAVNGTKKRLPREIEQQLIALEDGLRDALDNVQVEDTNCGEDDAPKTTPETVCNGGEKLPEELKPALELYAQLVSEGERLPTEKIEPYMRDAECYVAHGDKDFVFTAPNPDGPRRGVPLRDGDAALHPLRHGEGTGIDPPNRPHRDPASAGFLLGMLPAFLTAGKQTEQARAITNGATRQGRAQAQSRQGFRSDEPV